MPELATIDELIETLDLGGDNPARIKRDLLERALDSAEQTVAQLTGRQFWPEPALTAGGADTNPAVTKSFRVRNRPYPSGMRSIRVRITDIRSATQVLLDGSELLAGAEYDFETYDGGEPFTCIYLFQGIPASAWTSVYTSTLAITGRWGFLTVPDDIKEAVLQIAARRYHRRNAMFADQVDTGTGAFDFRGGVHPDVQSTLRRYRPVQVTLV